MHRPRGVEHLLGDFSSFLAVRGGWQLRSKIIPPGSVNKFIGLSTGSAIGVSIGLWLRSLPLQLQLPTMSFRLHSLVREPFGDCLWWSSRSRSQGSDLVQCCSHHVLDLLGEWLGIGGWWQIQSGTTKSGFELSRVDVLYRSIRKRDQMIRTAWRDDVQ